MNEVQRNCHLELCGVIKACCVMLSVATLTFLSGCGGSDGPVRAAVEGSVSLNGKKLAAGVVRFVPSDEKSGPAAVAMIKDGQFELDRKAGPVVGAHRVEIEATDYYGFAIDDEKAFTAAFKETKGKPLPPNPIPPIYNISSTLTADVKADEKNTFDFPLVNPAVR